MVSDCWVPQTSPSDIRTSIRVTFVRHEQILPVLLACLALFDISDSQGVAVTYIMTQKVTVTFVVGLTKSMTPQGQGVVRGRRDLLYDPKGHGYLCGWFDLVHDPKRSQGH